MADRIKSKREPVVADPEAHDEKGRFKKGHRVYSRKHRGDKITHDLKDAVLGGAIAHGSDGKGKDGLLGYCAMLATKYPKNYSYLLGKMLPLVVRDGLVQIGPVNVRVTPIAAGKFLTHEQMEKISGQGIVIDGNASEITPDDEQDNTTPRKGPLPH